MAINIKNPKAEATLRQIALILNIPMAKAAEQAFDILYRQTQATTQESLMEKWSRVGADNRRRLGEKAAQDILHYKDWMYDENGLPR
jgi:hypothetical protein